MSVFQYTVAEIAQRFGLAFHGDGNHVIDGVGTLAGATPSQLSFLSNGKYAAQLASTHAGVVLVREANVADCPTSATLVAADPYLTYAKVATLFEHVPAAPAGVHPSAIVAASARVSPTASVGPFCTIGEGSVVEDGVVLGAHCIVGDHCTIGAQTRLLARVTLVKRVTLGKRVLVHPGAVLGADGFGNAFERDHWVKIPQLGGVRVGDDCEIGANTTVDCGALEDTVLEEDVRLDNQIQIGHNCHIGAHSALAGCIGMAGSTKLGRYCLVGGLVGFAGHMEIADHTNITAMSMVSHSVREAGEYSSGVPIQESRVWRRNAARLRNLDEYVRRLQALEKDRNNE